MGSSQSMNSWTNTLPLSLKNSKEKTHFVDFQKKLPFKRQLWTLVLEKQARLEVLHRKEELHQVKNKQFEKDFNLILKDKI